MAFTDAQRMQAATLALMRFNVIKSVDSSSGGIIIQSATQITPPQTVTGIVIQAIVDIPTKIS